jgi:hypothetical protein
MEGGREIQWYIKNSESLISHLLLSFPPFSLYRLPSLLSRPLCHLLFPSHLSRLCRFPLSRWFQSCQTSIEKVNAVVSGEDYS